MANFITKVHALFNGLSKTEGNPEFGYRMYFISAMPPLARVYRLNKVDARSRPDDYVPADARYVVVSFHSTIKQLVLTYRSSIKGEAQPAVAAIGYAEHEIHRAHEDTVSFLAHDIIPVADDA